MEIFTIRMYRGKSAEAAKYSNCNSRPFEISLYSLSAWMWRKKITIAERVNERATGMEWEQEWKSYQFKKQQNEK